MQQEKFTPLSQCKIFLNHGQMKSYTKNTSSQKKKLSL